MTEDSRRSVDDPPREDDRLVPGFAAEQPAEAPGPPPATAVDIERVATVPGERAERGALPQDDLPADLPQDDLPHDDAPSGLPQDDVPGGLPHDDVPAGMARDDVPSGSAQGGAPGGLPQDDVPAEFAQGGVPDGSEGAGFAPPDAPVALGKDGGNGDKLLVSSPAPVMEIPAAGQEGEGTPRYEPYGQPPPPYQEAPPFNPVAAGSEQPPPYQEPSPYGQEPSQSGPYPTPEPRPRPGFAPHGQEAGEPGRYGWPPAQHQAPPPPSGPPLSTAPPPPGGALPLGAPGGGFGGPQGPGGAPNWAPVPGAPPAPRRGGPPLGVLAIVGLIVALVAGAVGAGIGVIAVDDDGPGSAAVSLGGGDSAPVKQRPPESVAGIAQRVIPSTVMIRVQSGNEGSAGTGFIVNGGYIITNNHVVASVAQGGGQIEIVFHDKKVSPADVQGRDPASDIAVLKPRTTHNLPALPMGDSESLAVGDPVIAIGSPLGLQGSVTSGIVSALNRAVPTQGEGADAAVIPAIQTDAAINPGNSGGPLVDGKGRVIGINTAIVTLGGGGLGGEQGGNIGLGFAIPINHGRRIAQEIINTGSAKRTLIGIGMDPQFAGPGVRIAEREDNGVQPIVPGGPADKAGLKPGDVITAIDGKPIEDRIDLSAAIQSKAPGTRVRVTFQRGGKEQTVDVILAAAN